MAFRIDDNSVSKKVTLEQLTAGLDPQKDQRKIDRITQIFNQYNTNTNGSSAEALDLDEQISLMNDLHKADGDGKGKNFDGKISKRGMKKAGLAGEYKAYKDFIEAYQKVLADDVNTYDLTYRDDTADGTQFTETRAVQEGETSTTEYKYNNLSGETARVLTTQTDEEGSRSFDPKGRLTRQVVDGTTIQYRSFVSDARNAQAGIITVRQEGVDGIQTLKLQDDGTYFDETNNSHYRLNRSGFLDEFVVDDKNRVTTEFWGDNQFDYAYEGENTAPSTITVNKGSQTERTYTQNGELYTSQNDETTEYFQFDHQKRQFTQTEAPQPPQPPVQKHAKPSVQKRIRMTEGWRNQRVKPDADTKAKFNSMSRAQEVLTELLKDKIDGGLNTETLLADLIKNNPSMFDADGIIYSDANWDRLDFPKDLSKYKAE